MSGKSAIVTTRNHRTNLSCLGILNTERVSKLSRSLATFGSYEKGAIEAFPLNYRSPPMLPIYPTLPFGQRLSQIRILKLILNI